MTDPASPNQPATGINHIVGLGVISAGLLLFFSTTLYQLVRLALNSDLYSHVVLVPLVSAWLVWQQRPHLRFTGPRLSPTWVAAFVFAGLGLLATQYLTPTLSGHEIEQDYLAINIYSLVLLFTGACCWALPVSSVRFVAFPLGFLFFMAPFPISVERALESLLQHGSAPVAESFFHLIGTSVYREETLFTLPNAFRMQVAPECSGIHSTIALFITSLVAGQLLLRTWWSRSLLSLAVIPLALVRNGLRVTVIGELCVREGPQMIDHYIHHKGGPIFFALSLIPFGLLLLFLIWVERKKYSSRATPSH